MKRCKEASASQDVVVVNYSRRVIILVTCEYRNVIDLMKRTN